MEKHRFHIFYAVKQFQKRWALLLLPLVNALVRFDLPGLVQSLYAEALMLAAMTALSLYVWRNAWWQLEGDRLTVCSGSWLRRAVTLSAGQLACVEVCRQPLQRMAGASRLNLYCADLPGRVPLYLTRRDAAQLAERLLPGPAPGSREFRPKAGDRVGLAAVSGNLFAGISLLLLGIDRGRQVLDQLSFVDRESMETAALSQFDRAAARVALWVPAGLASLLLAGALWALWVFTVSALRTARFRVSGDGQVLRTQSGRLTHVTRTIRLDYVTAADLNRSPMARLTRCFPVFLKAGGFRQEDVPCFLYRPGREAQLEALLPGWPLLAPAAAVPLKGRSLPAFVVLPGTCAGAGGVLFLVSRWALPQASWFFALAGLGCLVWLWFQLEGYFRESLTSLPDGRLLVVYTRGLTHHRVVTAAGKAGFSLSQTPLNLPQNRCTLRVLLPARLRLRVRSQPRGELELNTVLKVKGR